MTAEYSGGHSASLEVNNQKMHQHSQSTQSFVKFNVRAVTLQSQELKRLQSEQQQTASASALSQKNGKKTTPNKKDEEAAVKRKPRDIKSMCQMHGNLRHILKQTAKEQHEKRKQEMQEAERHSNAIRHLHQVTRIVPPKAETNIVKPKEKERNYLNFRQLNGAHEHTLLKKMVNQELDSENKELLDLAQRVGYLDPNRLTSRSSLAPPILSKNPSIHSQGIQHGRRDSQSRHSAGNQQEFFLKRRNQPKSKDKRRQSTAFSPSQLSNKAGETMNNFETLSNLKTKESVSQFARTMKGTTASSPFKNLKNRNELDSNYSRSMHLQQEQQRHAQSHKHIKPAAKSLKAIFAQKHSHKVSEVTVNSCILSDDTQTATASVFGKKRFSQQDIKKNLKQTKHEIYSFFHQGRNPEKSQASYRRNQQRQNQVKFMQTTVNEENSAYASSSPKLTLVDRASSDKKSFGSKKRSQQQPQNSTFFGSPPQSKTRLIKLKKTPLFTNQDELVDQSDDTDGQNQGVRTARRLDIPVSLAPKGSLPIMMQKSSSHKQYLPIQSSSNASSGNISRAQLAKDEITRHDNLESRMGGVSQATTAISPGAGSRRRAKEESRTAMFKNQRQSMDHAPTVNFLDQTKPFSADVGAEGNTNRSRNMKMMSLEPQGTDPLEKPRTSHASFVNQNMQDGRLLKSQLDLPNEFNHRDSGLRGSEQASSSLSFLQQNRTSQAKKSSAFLQKVQLQSSMKESDFPNKTKSMPTAKMSSRKVTVNRLSSAKRNKKKTTLSSQQSHSHMRENERTASQNSARKKPESRQSRQTLRESMGLVEKGKMRQDKENEEARKRRFEDFMHRMAIGFQKWIQSKLNDETFAHKNVEMNLKANIKKREAKHAQRLAKRDKRDQGHDTSSLFDTTGTNEEDTVDDLEQNDLNQWLQQTNISQPKHAATYNPHDLDVLVAQAQASITARDDKASKSKTPGTLKKTVTIQAMDDQGTNSRTLKLNRSPSMNNRRTLNRGQTCEILVSTHAQKSASFRKRATLRRGDSSAENLTGRNQSIKKDLSFQSEATAALGKRLEQEEHALEHLSQWKRNFIFITKVRKLRSTVQEWLLELCKESDKRDFDQMAKLISNYEQLEGQGVIGWALDRVKSISPTINQAEKKLNGVIEAVQFKYKRMQNYVLDQHDFKQNDFNDNDEHAIDKYDDEAQTFGAIHNINYVHQKLEGVKDIIMEKMVELIQRMFEGFVREFTHDSNPLFLNKLIFYCILKTEGDIMIQLGDYDKAIRAYKALRNYCRVWGQEYRQQEMWMAEQIGVAYRELRYHERAVDYFKYQLSLAWELQDLDAEMVSYDNLSTEYYYVGNIKKAKLYHERVFRGRNEDPNSTAKHASSLLNNYRRNFKEVKYNFDQIGLKGIKAENKGKRANFGEYGQHYVPKEESDATNELKVQQDQQKGRAKFENELYKDTEYRFGEGRGWMDSNPFSFKDTNGMPKHEKVIELHKRAARRNFFNGSKDEQEKMKEVYKPVNLRSVIKLKGAALEKSKPFSEVEFRLKIRESVNRLQQRERGKQERIFYSQLSKSRRCEKPKERAINQMKACRSYLDFMENYIDGIVREKNRENQAADKNNSQADLSENEGIETGKLSLPS